MSVPFANPATSFGQPPAPQRFTPPQQMPQSMPMPTPMPQQPSPHQAFPASAPHPLSAPPMPAAGNPPAVPRPQAPIAHLDVAGILGRAA